MCGEICDKHVVNRAPIDPASKPSRHQRTDSPATKRVRIQELRERLRRYYVTLRLYKTSADLDKESRFYVYKQAKLNQRLGQHYRFTLPLATPLNQFVTQCDIPPVITMGSTMSYARIMTNVRQGPNYQTMT